MLAAALTLFLGLAAAAPAKDLVAPQASQEGPGTVKVNGVSLLGSGCPAGTGDVQVDATGELFEATFSAYEVQTGPGTMASDWRKNCKLTMNLEFERGFQFSIMATDMIGFAEIPSGARGVCKNTFSFTGQTSSGGIDKVDFDLALPGHYSGDFDLHADPGIFSWSPCDGSTAILNMNTQCSISPTSQTALIAVCPFQNPGERDSESTSSISASSSSSSKKPEKKKKNSKGGKEKDEKGNEKENGMDCEAWAKEVMGKTNGWEGENAAKLGKQVDHISGKLTVRFRLAWRPCSFRP